MHKRRFNEDQIISILSILKESEARVPTLELCRKHGSASQTLYTGGRGSTAGHDPSLQGRFT